MNPQTNVTYQKYIELLKSQIFNWIDGLDKHAIDKNFYANLFPEILLNSLIDKPTALSSVLQKDWLIYIGNTKK